MKNADTIYAVASGYARAAISVIRISGSQAFEALQILQGELQPHGKLALRKLYAGKGCDKGGDKGGDKEGEVLDRALTVCFKAPKSYTGENMVEVHCHGSKAVIAAIFDAWQAQDGLRLRLAEPGEFTKRALLAGKIDITRAEGLIDLINAETQAQRRQALAQSEGALARLYKEWGERLFALLCQREALIDFPDEDLDNAMPAELQEKPIAILQDEISSHLKLKDSAERIRSGVAIAIVGEPNVGKSSFLNRIAQEEAAIVSARAGTTRDVVRVRVEIAGLAVDLLDTAGLREAQSEVEAEGILRAKKAIEQAHIVVRLLDASRVYKSGSREKSSEKNLEESSKKVSKKVSKKALKKIGEVAYDFSVLNKSDLLGGVAREEIRDSEEFAGCFLLSALSGEGVCEFLAALGRRLGDIPQGIAPTRARYGEVLARVCRHLREAQSSEDWALQAQALREAHGAMGSLTGTRDIEAVLDKIFADFCIGK